MFSLRIKCALALSLATVFAASQSYAFGDNQTGPANASNNTPTASTTTECNVNGNAIHSMAACSSGVGVAVTTTTNAGVSSDDGASVVPIDVWNLCRYIDNSSGSSIFVPFNTATEWSDFLTAAPTSLPTVALVHCSRPYTLTAATWTIPAPYGTCVGTETANTPPIYARWTSASPGSWIETPAPASFSCHGSATVTQDNVNWTGLDSDVSTPSWKPTALYGPDLTLTITNPTAAQNSTNRGTSIVVSSAAPGTPVTLTWASVPYTAGDPLTCTGFTATTGVAPACPSSSGSVIVTPASTTSYAMTVLDTRTSLSSTATVTVIVDKAISATLTASPTLVAVGGSSTLSWSVTDTANLSFTCTESSSDNSWMGTTPAATGSTTGTATVTPKASTTYTLTCKDSLNDTTTATAKVNVGQAITVTLSANPTSVESGTSSTLSWTVSDPSNLSMTCTESSSDNNWKGTITSSAAIVGSGAVSTMINTTYTLSCIDSLNNTSTATATISVYTCVVDPSGFGTICGGNPPGGGAKGNVYDLSPYSSDPDHIPMSEINADTWKPVYLSTSTLNIPYEADFVGLGGYTSWFGVCYHGTWNTPSAGKYTFVAAVDDAMAMWVDGQLIGQLNYGVVSNIMTPDSKKTSGALYDDVPLNKYNKKNDQTEPLPEAFAPVTLSAGNHEVMVYYMQVFAPILGLQLWVVPPGQSYTANSHVWPPLTPSTGLNTGLMQFTDPPTNGVMACPIPSTVSSDIVSTTASFP